MELDLKAVACDGDDFAEEPAARVAQTYEHVEVGAHYNFMAPRLMAQCDLLDLLVGVHKVEAVQVARRLETPGRGANKSVVKAPQTQLLEEEVDPGFVDVGKHFQVLDRQTTEFLVNITTRQLIIGTRYARISKSLRTSSSPDFSRVICDIKRRPKVSFT